MNDQKRETFQCAPFVAVLTTVIIIHIACKDKADLPVPHIIISIKIPPPPLQALASHAP